MSRPLNANLGVRNIIFLALTLVLVTLNRAPAAPRQELNVAFGADCETVVCDAIDSATNDVCVAIYSITRRNISSALVRAAKRGVSVQLKYDKTSAEWEGMQKTISYLSRRGVKCTAIAMRGEYAKMHHKFTVIDNNKVVTGSYNYTTAGTTANYENVVLIHSPQIAQQYQAEFAAIRGR